MDTMLHVGHTFGFGFCCVDCVDTISPSLSENPKALSIPWYLPLICDSFCASDFSDQFDFIFSSQVVRIPASLSE